jgi:6-phospho-beta-glucosidase
VKAAVVGAGSTYTPELVDGLLRQADRLPLEVLALVDPDERRLRVLAGFVSRMVDQAGSSLRVEPVTDLREGVAAASWVFSQFRVGGQTARRGDEELGRRWGIVGQETTGVGGLAKGLRTVPVALEVQRAVAAYARPEAWLVNFTNPAGMVTEALLTHGAGDPPRVVGLCNFPTVLRSRLASGFGVPVDSVDLDYVGLNHLAWVRAVWIDGEPRLREALDLWRSGPDAPFAPTLVDDIGLVLNPYLQYYYETGRVLEQQLTTPTRATVVADAEAALLRTYADPRTRWSPSLLSGRGGASYSVAAASLAADLQAASADPAAVPMPPHHVLNVRNGSPGAPALPGLPDDAVVETTCAIDGGVTARQTEPLAEPVRGLANQVKDFERYAIAAALDGDVRATRLALLTHPLCPDGSSVPRLAEDLLATNRDWLPRFAR